MLCARIKFKDTFEKVLLGVSCVSSRVSKDEAHTPAVDLETWQSSAPYDLNTHTHTHTYHRDLDDETPC